jgi:hypothetical protein
MIVELPLKQAPLPAIRVESGRLILSMGLASITLHEDGRIEVMGKTLHQQLSSNVSLCAERVDFMIKCPP